MCMNTLCIMGNITKEEKNTKEDIHKSLKNKIKKTVRTHGIVVGY